MLKYFVIYVISETCGKFNLRPLLHAPPVESASNSRPSHAMNMYAGRQEWEKKSLCLFLFGLNKSCGTFFFRSYYTKYCTAGYVNANGRNRVLYFIDLLKVVKVVQGRTQDAYFP